MSKNLVCPECGQALVVYDTDYGRRQVAICLNCFGSAELGPDGTARRWHAANLFRPFHDGWQLQSPSK